MRKKSSSKLGCAAIIAFVILVPIALFLAPVFLMLGWNFGVVALFPAVPAMGYWHAFWINWLLGIIGSKFKSTIDLNKFNN